MAFEIMVKQKHGIIVTKLNYGQLSNIQKKNNNLWFNSMKNKLWNIQIRFDWYKG